MPRNNEVNQRVKEERREQILDTALKLFVQKGLAATKITDIAQASDISQGLLYHYYRSKEEIFTELIRIGFERLNGACRWLEAQPMTAREKITFAITELLKLLEQDEDAARYHFLIAQATATEALPEETKRLIQQENGFPYESITRIMAEGQKNGSIKEYNAAQLALVFWSSINGLAINKAVHGAQFKAPEAGILTGMFLKE